MESNPDLANIEDAAKLLTFIDSQEIEELDPCKEDGNYHINTEKDLPMDVSIKQTQRSTEDLQSNEMIKIKLLVKGEDQDLEGAIRVELTSEDDIFFHYVCE